MEVTNLQPPELPHVDASTIPLSEALAKYCHHTYNQLQQLIATLGNESESDMEKKKRLLDSLVIIREDFVKLYVIAKWSRSAKSISTLVDLFASLRGQNEMYSFTIREFMGINFSLANSKIPNPDISTALEVLVKSRPLLNSYGFISASPLTNQCILNTIREINVALATRLALSDNLPDKFLRYTIKNGRAIFNIEKEFETSISLADTASESAPFFFVDFKFGFSARDNCLTGTPSALPEEARLWLEARCNTVLSTNDLDSLYKTLSQFAVTYKLYLIHRQLIAMRRGIWKGNLTHTYSAEKCCININYWTKRATSPLIQIGLNKLGRICFRWIKNGTLMDVDPSCLHNEKGDISIEALLQKITSIHVEMNITKIKAYLKGKNFVAGSTHNSLILSLSYNKSAVYQINALSGEAYFQNPTPVMSSLVRQINADPTQTAAKLLSLRVETQTKEITGLLTATGWVMNNLIHLSSAEISKLCTSVPHQVRFFRRKEWPTDWFFVVVVSLKIQCWAARIVPTLGHWILEWSDSLKSMTRIAYSDISSLANNCVAKLLSQVVINELESRGSKLLVLDPSKVEGLPITVEATNSAYLVVDNRTLTQIPSCASSIFIITRLLENASFSIQLMGKVECPGLSVFHNDESSSLTVNPETGDFSIECVKEDVNLLGLVLLTTQKFTDIISALHCLAQDVSVKVLYVSMERLELQYGVSENVVFDWGQESMTLRLSPTSPHLPYLTHLTKLLSYREAKLSEKVYSVVTLLKRTLPLVSVLRQIEETPVNNPLHWQIVPYGVTKATIMYTGAPSSQKAQLATPGQSPHSNKTPQRTRVRLNVELRRKPGMELSDNGVLFFVWESSGSLKSLLQNTNTEGCVFLGSGVACSVDVVSRVLTAAHARVVENMRG